MLETFPFWRERDHIEEITRMTKGLRGCYLIEIKNDLIYTLFLYLTFFMAFYRSIVKYCVFRLDKPKLRWIRVINDRLTLSALLTLKIKLSMCANFFKKKWRMSKSFTSFTCIFWCNCYDTRLLIEKSSPFFANQRGNDRQAKRIIKAKILPSNGGMHSILAMLWHPWLVIKFDTAMAAVFSGGKIGLQTLKSYIFTIKT